MPPRDLGELFRQVASGSRDHVEEYLAALGQVPASLSDLSDAFTLASPLQAPAGERSFLDYVGVYVTAREYLVAEEAPEEEIGKLAEKFAGGSTAMTLLTHLALLNTAYEDDDVVRLGDELVGALVSPYADRLSAVLAEPDVVHHVVARQPLLAAMRYVLTAGCCGMTDEDPTPLLAAVLLEHVVAASLASEQRGERSIGGVPESLFFEFLRLGCLYQADDMWSSIDRVVRLWETFGSAISKVPLRGSPAQLLEEATGLSVLEFLAFGFALYAHMSQWEPGSPHLLSREFGPGVEQSLADRFCDAVVSTPEALAGAFAGRTGGAFDFLPIQERPVLDLPGGLLVLDDGYLWDRVTSGLFWIVHDQEKARSDLDRQRWTQGFAEAVELFAEDVLRRVAPTVLGNGSTLYTEEDLEAAYPDAKHCDVAIDFGDCFVLIEVVSAQLSVRTRIDGDVDAFEADAERLIFKKCRQLDEAATPLLEDRAHALTGIGRRSLVVQPVLVIGSGLPIAPPIARFIYDELETRGQFEHPDVARLCIVGLAELELLEGLAEVGHDLVTVLRSWKASPLSDVSLRNYVLAEYGPDARALRPSRMKPSVDETFRQVQAVLGFGDRGVDD